MNLVGKKTLVAMLCLSSVMNTALADEALLTQRIERLERIIQGQGLVSLLSRVDQLQSDIQRLNGDNESLRHEIEQMQDRQRQLYLDLDQRLEEQKLVGSNSALTSETSAPDLSDVTPSDEQTQTGTTESTATEQTTESVESTNVANAPVAVENGEAAYQAALQTLRSGNYEEAVKALTSFPQQYPQSSYLPNAYYWQGEANYVLRQFDEAIKNFQKVITSYPGSSKVADATLKLGFSQYEKGAVEQAKATLNSVMTEFPNTSAARLAKVRLERMN
jgi:tol-pal system protein YbgF